MNVLAGQGEPIKSTIPNKSYFTKMSKNFKTQL